MTNTPTQALVDVERLRARRYPVWAKFAIKPEYVGQDVAIYSTIEAARYEHRRGIVPGRLCRIIDNFLMELRA